MQPSTAAMSADSKDPRRLDDASSMDFNGTCLAADPNNSFMSTFSIYKAQLDTADEPNNPSRASTMSVQLLTNSSALTEACKECKQHDATVISTVASCWLTATSILSKQYSRLHWWQADPLWLSIPQWSAPLLQHQLLDLTTALVTAAAQRPADAQAHTLTLQAAAAILQFVLRCTKLLSRLKQRALTYDVRYKFKTYVVTRWWESRGAAERVEAWMKLMDCKIMEAVHREMLEGYSVTHCAGAVQAVLDLAVTLEQISKHMKLGGKFITNHTWRKLVTQQSRKLSLDAAASSGRRAAAAVAVPADADVSAALARLCELEEPWRVERRISLTAKPVQNCREEVELRQQQEAGALKLFSTDEFLRPKFPSRAASFTEISGAWARPDAGNRRKITF